MLFYCRYAVLSFRRNPAMAEWVAIHESFYLRSIGTPGAGYCSAPNVPTERNPCYHFFSTHQAFLTEYSEKRNVMWKEHYLETI